MKYLLSIYVFVITLLIQPTLHGREIRIIAVGDIMMGSTFPQSFLPPDNGRHLFGNVRAILSRGDITFGNLEETLNRNCKSLKSVKHGRVYAFRSPPEYAGLLTGAGFTVVSLANNHAMDFGECGLIETRDALRKAGLQFADKDGNIATFKFGQRTVVLLAVGFGNPPGSIVHPKEILEKIEAFSGKFDIVIVSVHAGKEGLKALHTKNETEIYLGENRGNIVQFAHDAIDAGADLIIGHGPHVPRAMEIYRDRLIIYSLGNFCTYGWISIKGEKGLAPIAEVIIDSRGRFIRGRIYSFMQVPPGYPVKDPEERAFKLIKKLSLEDFPETAPSFDEDGTFHNGTLHKKR